MQKKNAIYSYLRCVTYQICFVHQKVGSSWPVQICLAVGGILTIWKNLETSVAWTPGSVADTAEQVQVSSETMPLLNEASTPWNPVTTALLVSSHWTVTVWVLAGMVYWVAAVKMFTLSSGAGCSAPSMYKVSMPSQVTHRVISVRGDIKQNNFKTTTRIIRMELFSSEWHT